MKTTINDIARMAGVSKATVSRVLNNKGPISEATRHKVMSVIEAHNYQPNAFAQAVSCQVSKSNCIAVVVPHAESYIMSNPVFADIFRGISDVLSSQQYYYFSCFTNSPEYLSSLFLQNRVDGFIFLSPTNQESPLLMQLNRIGAPIVSTTSIDPDGELTFHVPFADIDNYHAAFLAMSHLHSLGHRKIAFISAELSATKQGKLLSILSRQQAYLDALAATKTSPIIATASYNAMDAGYNTMQELLLQGLEFSSVFCCTDLIAIGAMKALHDKGFSVPSDLSIVGFDGIPWSAFTFPALTTIQQASYSRGRCVAEMIIDYIKNGNAPADHLFQAELIVRESTASI